VVVEVATAGNGLEADQEIERGAAEEVGAHSTESAEGAMFAAPALGAQQVEAGEGIVGEGVAATVVVAVDVVVGAGKTLP
jgi:hypothetical protein